MSAVNREPERWEELAADASLVGLSAAEEDELHLLLGAEDAAFEVAMFERAAGEVAAAAFSAQRSAEGAELLSASLRSRLEARLIPRASHEPEPTRKATATTIDDARVTPPRAWPLARVAPWLLAAAAIILAITSRRPLATPVSPVVTTRTPAAERAELLTIAGTAQLDFAHTEDPAARQGGGDVVWHSGLQRGYMRIRGLAPNDPAKEQYQLWIFDAERGDTFPVDGGVFDVKPSAQGEVVVPIAAKLAVGKAKLFAITVERPGGVVVSKRERIVLTAAASS